MPAYVFNGTNHSYGGKKVTANEQIAAYEAAPVCHHPERKIATVAINDLSNEDWAVIVANKESANFDPTVLLESDDE